MNDTSILYSDCKSNLQRLQVAVECYKLVKEQIDSLYNRKIKQYIFSGVVFLFGIAMLSATNVVPLVLGMIGSGVILLSTIINIPDEINKKESLKHSVYIDILKFRAYVFAEEQDVLRRADKEKARQERQQSFDDWGSSFNRNKYSNTGSSTGQRGTFKDCVTVKDVKKVYKLKAKKHHPDVGGDPEIFKKLVIQYERALKIAQG